MQCVAHRQGAVATGGELCHVLQGNSVAYDVMEAFCDFACLEEYILDILMGSKKSKFKRLSQFHHLRHTV